MKALAHHCRKRTGMAARDVGNVHRRGVELAGTAHRADHGQAEAMSLAEQEYFGRQRVDGIDNVVVPCLLQDL